MSDPSLVRCCFTSRLPPYDFIHVPPRRGRPLPNHHTRTPSAGDRVHFTSQKCVHLHTLKRTEDAYSRIYSGCKFIWVIFGVVMAKYLVRVENPKAKR